jgi:LysM repeat protein
MNLSTKLLIALLVVLCLVVYFLLPSEKEREASYKTPAILLKIDSAAVVKIEIKQSSRSVVIENIGGTWMLTSPLRASADPVAVAQLLNGLSKFKMGSLISSNPEKQHLFQVDTAGTRLILAERSGKIFNIIVGKMGPSFSEIYFRLPDSKDVYLGDGIDSWAINKNVKDWRDKSIVHTPADEMNEISISTGSKIFIFHHENGAWKLGDKTVETNEMNPLLNTLSNLRADDFVDSATEIKSKPIVLNIKGGANTTLSLYPATSDSARYIVQSSNSKQLYLIGKWTVQQLFKPTGKSTPQAAPIQQVAETRKPVHAIPEKKHVPEPSLTKVTSKSEGGVKSASALHTPATKEVIKPAPAIVTEKKAMVKTPPSNKKPPVENPLSSKQSSESSVPPKEKDKKNVVETPQAGDDEGTLVVYTVQKGETMTTIAKKYNVRTEQILKWNLLKSIAVKPGQELYIYTRK